jgi:hypothetical protein
MGRKVGRDLKELEGNPPSAVSSRPIGSRIKAYKKIVDPRHAEFDPFSRERLSDKHARFGEALRKILWPDNHSPIALTLFVAPLSYHDDDSVSTHYLAVATLIDGKKGIDRKLLWFVAIDFPAEKRFGLQDVGVYRADDESGVLYSNSMDYSDYGFGKDLLFSLENLGHKDYLDASIGNEKFQLMDVLVLLKASPPAPPDPNASTSAWLD